MPETTGNSAETVNGDDQSSEVLTTNRVDDPVDVLLEGECGDELTVVFKHLDGFDPDFEVTGGIHGRDEQEHVTEDGNETSEKTVTLQVEECDHEDIELLELEAVTAIGSSHAYLRDEVRYASDTFEEFTTAEATFDTVRLTKADDDKRCVVCGSEEHDGDGWIYHTSDTEVTEITPNGPKRELEDDARPICSEECKEEFEESDESPWPDAEILDAEPYDGDEPCRAHHPDDPECGRDADYRVMFGADHLDRPRTFLAAAECVDIPDDILSDTEGLQTENDCREQEEERDNT